MNARAEREHERDGEYRFVKHVDRLRHAVFEHGEFLAGQ
jgi:hypothetical protein